MNPLYTTNTLDDGFSVTVSSLLLGLGAELYIPIFKKYNFGKKDLEEITNEDLIIMGIDDSVIRKKILQLFNRKHDEALKNSLNFTPNDRTHIVKETTKLMELIRLSLNRCKRNVANAREPEDVLLRPNIYATDIMLETINEIETKLKKIRNILMKENRVSASGRRKNVTILSVGTVAIVIGLCCYRCLKFNG